VKALYLTLNVFRARKFAVFAKTFYNSFNAESV
jgi:hypothetical protein